MTCRFCDASLEGMRSNAIYCSRRCKTKASDERRKQDGRASARDRARYAREAEHRREYARRYLAENPERMRAIRRKRQAKISFDRLAFTEKDWRRLLLQYRNRCAYCGGSGELQREHVIPLSRGGRHSVGNIVPACQGCNYSKHTKTIAEWRLSTGRR